MSSDTVTRPEGNGGKNLDERVAAKTMLNAAGLDPETVLDNKYWFYGGAVVFLIGGALAILMPHLATIGAEIFVGAVFLISGITELIRAFRLKGRSRIVVNALFGLVGAAAGALLLLFPLPGILTLTALVAALFLIGGGLKLWHAFELRPLKGWSWMAASGGLSILLALLIMLALPASALWTLGLLLGIDLILFGTSLIALVQGAKISRAG